MSPFSQLNGALLAALSFVGSAWAQHPEQLVLTPSDQSNIGQAAYIPKNVHDALVDAEIIPTVIDDFQPSLALDVEWDKAEASLGNTLKVKKVQDQPDFSLRPGHADASSHCRSNMTFVITLTDPDAPSRDDPKWAEMCHFIAAGLPLSPSDSDSCSEIRLGGLEDIMPYKAPGPPPKTGKHRYVFLVFVPRNGTADRLHLSKPADRQHWGFGEGHGVRDWADENGLWPVAANFFYAKNKKQ